MKVTSSILLLWTIIIINMIFKAYCYYCNYISSPTDTLFFCTSLEFLFIQFYICFMLFFLSYAQRQTVLFFFFFIQQNFTIDIIDFIFAYISLHLFNNKLNTLISITSSLPVFTTPPTLYPQSNILLIQYCINPIPNKSYFLLLYPLYSSILLIIYASPFQ